MEIKKLYKKDIRKAIALVWKVFQEFEAPDYSEEGIQEFKNFISYDSIIDKFDKGKLSFWGCLDNEDLIGVIAVRGYKHICLLFVKKEFHKRGIARSLVQKVKDNCKSENNIKKITVNSSPYAIEVYHHLGFTDTDKEQTINGIRFIPMSCFIK